MCTYIWIYMYMYTPIKCICTNLCIYVCICMHAHTRTCTTHTNVWYMYIYCIFILRYNLISKIYSLFYLLPFLCNKVCHGILSSFPHCTPNFSVANSEFAFIRRHFICPALRGIINHILLLGYLRMFIYVRRFFGKTHYKEGIESWKRKLLCKCTYLKK